MQSTEKQVAGRKKGGERWKQEEREFNVGSKRVAGGEKDRDI